MRVLQQDRFNRKPFFGRNGTGETGRKVAGLYRGKCEQVANAFGNADDESAG